MGLNYIGITHRDPYKYKGSGVYWKKHLKFHKFKSVDIHTIILFETTDYFELCEKGKYYSELYDIVNSKYWANLIPETGENSVLGMKHSDETKKKISLIHKGRFSGSKNPMFGKIVSEETRKKISNSNIGQKRTQETKNKISNKLKGNKNTLGYKHSEETKKKFSESNRGKRKKPKSEEEKKLMSERCKSRGNPNYNPISVLQFDKNNILIREWPDLYSLIESGYTIRQKKEISRACRGKIKTYNGYIWKFKE